MKTKKFEGPNEQELLEQVREELGLSAIIVSIKKKQGRGLAAFFKKPTIVVTAAYEDTDVEKDKLLSMALDAIEAKEPVKMRKGLDIADLAAALPTKQENLSFPAPPQPPPVPHDPEKDMQIANQQNVIHQLERQVVQTEEMLARTLERLSATEQQAATANGRARKYKDDKVQLVYDSLVDQGVLPEIAETLMEEANAIDSIDINLLVKIVYNKIVKVLGNPRMVIGKEPGQSEPKIVVFMGPTGVGKTTTIAKLSSILLLNQHMRVGLITADTYRIAAVEQLKTYADILDLEMGVVYDAGDVGPNIKNLGKSSDVILIDTAGRSHHNKTNLAELKEMLDRLPKSEKYLVLSVTTRQEDLLAIINTYDSITNFDLIFTKLDETSSLGIILNTCFLTGKEISYVTFGQNVPEDISEVQAERIAKALMGLHDNGAGWGGFD